MLGTPLAAGREYDWTDIHQKRQVVLISENFAREYWGSAAAAIGKRIRSNPNDAWSEVIGVVADIRHDGAERPAPSTVYWPLRSSRSATFMIRGPRAGTEGYAAEIRRAVSAVSGGLPITQMQTMQQVYDKSMSRTAFTLTLLGISGGMALLLAAIGIYAVIAYTVSQRTREIGIRLALGARQERLQLMFVRSGLLWGGIGAAAGLVAAAPLSQLMSALLFEVDADRSADLCGRGGRLARRRRRGQLPAGAPRHADPPGRGAPGRVAGTRARPNAIRCPRSCIDASFSSRCRSWRWRPATGVRPAGHAWLARLRRRPGADPLLAAAPRSTAPTCSSSRSPGPTTRARRAACRRNPIVVGGTLYATTPQHKVVALDAATGAVRWTFDSGLDGRGAEPRRHLLERRPGERASSPPPDQYVYALDAAHRAGRSRRSAATGGSTCARASAGRRSCSRCG